MFILFKVIVLLIITIVQGQNQSLISFEDSVLETGDACVSVRNGVVENGVCQPILNCPSIMANVMRKQFVHTVCGYEGKIQIICCPTATAFNAIQLQQRVNLNLKSSLECRVGNTNEVGNIKFLSDCPQLNNQNSESQINKICTDDVCSDLVCCPGPVRNRLKNVCANVDHPSETLEVRLNLNQECTVKELNIKGRLQNKCDYAERNPNLKPMLQNVCTDKLCEDWYCCPIENQDTFECTGNQISSTSATLVGPKCIDSKTGQRGTCKRSFNCAHPNVDTLDRCGSYCCYDFYCCPDDFGAANQPISTRACNSYIKYLAKEEIEVEMDLYVNRSGCPSLTFVAGGIIANPGEFPHMAALGYRPKQEIEWKCGGSLISDRFVLTAGHCLTDRSLGSVQKVRLGVIDLLNDIDTDDCPEDFDVARLIPHPEYISKFVYNDIGLIELATKVEFNFHIRPLCLPFSGDVKQYYESMGWGATGTAEELSIKLIKANQELFSFDECKIQYDSGRRLPNGIINETQICAGSRDSIQSTCPGDSGGPLIVHHDKFYSLFYIEGIVSFGNACGFANSPGVYTKVFPYVKWIEDTVWKA